MARIQTYRRISTDPAATENRIDLDDLLLGSDRTSGATRNFPIRDLIPLIEAEDGNTILSGPNPPTSGDGVEGDWYIQRTPTDAFLFGPRGANSWPTNPLQLGGTDGMDGDSVDGVTATTLANGNVELQFTSGGANVGNVITIQRGADGADGDDGRTILNGTTFPQDSVGVDGDFFLLTGTNTRRLVGPKAGGTWGSSNSGVELIGDDGMNGTNGTNGRGITSITRTGGNGAAGTVDTYTITYDSGPTSNFMVTNGADGAPGATGAAGAAATIAFRPVVTGPAGSQASLDNSGSNTAANIEFTIPQGAQGVQGAQGRYELDIFIRAASQPTTPSGGTITNGQISTPPVGWSDTVAGTTGTEHVWESRFSYNPANPSAAINWSTPFQAGSQGPAGTDGADGLTILSGNGGPNNMLGVDGDFYIELDPNSRVLFGPKAMGAWPTSGIELVGTDGTNGLPGAAGNGIASITRTGGTGMAGSLDSYTILFDDASTSSFTVQNGVNGVNGTNGTNGTGISTIIRTMGDGSAGTIDTYTITFTDASTTTFDVRNGANGANGTNGTNGTNGRGITNIARTAGDGSAGTVDTYTITYDTGNPTMFMVTNGSNGSTGPAGAAATIQVLSTTTGAAGTMASVTNAGTANAAELQFVIPRGATGAAGTNGTDGRTVLSGNGVPNGSVAGAVGDFYIDLDTYIIYGPKTSTNSITWPTTGEDLRAPAGFGVSERNTNAPSDTTDLVSLTGVRDLRFTGTGVNVSADGTTAVVNIRAAANPVPAGVSLSINNFATTPASPFPNATASFSFAGDFVGMGLTNNSGNSSFVGGSISGFGITGSNQIPASAWDIATQTGSFAGVEPLSGIDLSQTRTYTLTLSFLDSSGDTHTVDDQYTVRRSPARGTVDIGPLTSNFVDDNTPGNKSFTITVPSLTTTTGALAPNTGDLIEISGPGINPNIGIPVGTTFPFTTAPITNTFTLDTPVTYTAVTVGYVDSHSNAIGDTETIDLEVTRAINNVHYGSFAATAFPFTLTHTEITAAVAPSTSADLGVINPNMQRMQLTNVSGQRAWIAVDESVTLTHVYSLATNDMTSITGLDILGQFQLIDSASMPAAPTGWKIYELSGRVGLTYNLYILATQI